MIGAVRNRLADLLAVAGRLGEMLEEPGASSLPGLVICRVGLAADEAASKLEQLANMLATAGSQARDANGKELLK